MDQSLKTQDDAAAAVAKAPRVTLDHIESLIAAENYLNVGDAVCRTGQPDTLPMHLTTLCILTLRNGFLVMGESACASPENFNADLGRQVARRHAIEKIWLLEGYLLRQRLHEGATST